MRYIKPFNENVTQSIEDKCEAHLAYLLDEGFEVIYDETNDIIQKRDFIIEIKLTTPSVSRVSYNYKHFTWNNVKDRVIPLVTQLNKEYEIEVDISDGSTKYCTVDWVINDGPARYFAPNSIRWIRIIVNRYLFKKGAKL
jgi:hypothetical protein